MLPEKSCDKINCLQSLIGIKAECGALDCADFYIEDIEGIDIDKLSQIASSQSPSGISVAKDLIRTASKEMLGDIELLIGNGYTLNDTFGDLCSSCDFISVYQAAGGVKVQSTILSNYSILRISKIDILTNYTGTALLDFNDGKTIKQYTVALQSGVISPVIFDYSTTEKIVKIYFDDPTITLGQIQCLTNKSCGCGGARNREAIDTIRYSGLLNGADYKTQYGFKICANISCSSDLLTCDLVSKTPLIFALTLLYKIGQKAYSSSVLQTSRITPFTSSNGEEKRIDMKDYYEGLYKQRLNGKGQTKGISQIINNYLRQRTDNCVNCQNSTSKIGWAVG